MSAFLGKIGVHAITWGQEHLKAMEEASCLGYQAIEPWPSFALQYEHRESELQQLLASYGLAMTALYGGATGESDWKFIDPSKREDIIHYNDRLAQIIAKCGAGHLVFGPGGPRQKATTLEELKEAAVTINEAAKRTYAWGVKACVHPHLWTELQDDNELNILMELCDPNVVFLALDTAHVTGAGMDVPAFIHKYKERLAYIHLKDFTREDATREDFPMLPGNEEIPIFCELGLGRIHFSPIIEALCDIQYDSWVTVEIDQSTSSPYRSLEICRDFVEQQLQIPIRKGG